jgi:hypothetical protein
VLVAVCFARETRASAPAFYNPAGLAFHGRRELAFGYLRVLPNLEIRTARGSTQQEISEPNLMLLGVVVPIGEHFAIGYAGVLLPDTILHVDAAAPETPFFPYFANRTQRLVILPALAARPFDWLAAGIAVNFFAGLSGGAQASEGPTRRIEPTVSEELPTVAALHLGLRATPLRDLALAVAYRQGFAVPYTTATRNVVAGAPLDIAVDARALETPDELAAGAELTLGDLALSFDATWLRWSESPGPFVRVEALVSGVTLDQPPPEHPYRDTYNLRLGAALQDRLSEKLLATYRFGQFYEPTFVRDQPGRSNLLDGDKLGWSLGAGLTFEHVLPRPFRIDAHAQLVHVFSRRHDKRLSSIEEASKNPDALADEDSAPGVQIENPGFPFVGGSGQVMTLGATVTVEVEP